MGAHLVAYNGRDDGLFRGAIAESGAPLRFSKCMLMTLRLILKADWILDPSVDTFQPVYNAIINQAGCASSNDTLNCLRELPYAKLNAILNSTAITAAVKPSASYGSPC